MGRTLVVGHEAAFSPRGAKEVCMKGRFIPADRVQRERTDFAGTLVP